MRNISRSLRTQPRYTFKPDVYECVYLFFVFFSVFCCLLTRSFCFCHFTRFYSTFFFQIYFSQFATERFECFYITYFSFSFLFFSLSFKRAHSWFPYLFYFVGVLLIPLYNNNHRNATTPFFLEFNPKEPIDITHEKKSGYFQNRSYYNKYR